MSSTNKLLQLNRIKQAQVRLTNMPPEKLVHKSSPKRRIYEDDDEDFEPEKARTPSKKAKVTKPPPKSPRTIQHEQGKKLIKKAIAQTTKVSKSGILTRRKRQEIEVKQFEQAKAAASASGYESSSSDVIYIPKKDKHNTEEKNDSEASSYTARSKKNKKKKKKKRRSEDDDDMIYLYMSFDEPETPEKRTKTHHVEEVESRSSRRSRSRSASVATAVTDTGDDKAAHVREVSPKGKSKGKGEEQKSILIFVVRSGKGVSYCV